MATLQKRELYDSASKDGQTILKKDFYGAKLDKNFRQNVLEMGENILLEMEKLRIENAGHPEEQAFLIVEMEKIRVLLDYLEINTNEVFVLLALCRFGGVYHGLITAYMVIG